MSDWTIESATRSGFSDSVADRHADSARFREHDNRYVDPVVIASTEFGVHRAREGFAVGSTIENPGRRTCVLRDQLACRFLVLDWKNPAAGRIVALEHP